MSGVLKVRTSPTTWEAVGGVGPKGDKGDTGAASTVPGPQGIPGTAGTQGVKGDKGDPGTAGTQGIQGIQGIQGPPGELTQASADTRYLKLAGGTLTGTTTLVQTGINGWFAVTGAQPGFYCNSPADAVHGRHVHGCSRTDSGQDRT